MKGPPGEERRSEGDGEPNVEQQPNLRANEQGAASNEFLSVQILAREARKIVVELDLPISGARTRKLVRQFVNQGHASMHFRTWFLTYADPTGETAVTQVLRGSRDD